MFLGRLMRSAMVLISLKAFSMARSELLMVRRFWYLELPNSSKLAAPVPCGGGEPVLISLRWHRGCAYNIWQLLPACAGIWTDLHAKNKQTSCCYSNCCRSNLPPCLSWWWGRLRWAAGFEHLPLWRGLWGLSRWKTSSTLSPRQSHDHLRETFIRITRLPCRLAARLVKPDR